MGQLQDKFFPGVWYVYQRMVETDSYDSEPVQMWSGFNEEEALAAFKHEIYAYALDEHDYNKHVKSIYLYHGQTRVAKATKVNDQKQTNIWSTKIRCFIDQTEKLAKNRYPLFEKRFFKAYHKDLTWIDAQSIAYVQKISQQTNITI